MRKQLKRAWARVRNIGAEISYKRSPDTGQYSDGPDTFVLYRILGNSLPPRHSPTQTTENLRFMLDHEPELEGCEKWWIVNRIFDRDVRDAVIALLEERGANYFEITFEAEDFNAIDDREDIARIDAVLAAHKSKVDADPKALWRAGEAKLRLKNLYVMNNNGARNAALAHGRDRAKWVLPWDGNCFLTAKGWAGITQSAAEQGFFPYHIVPMVRTLSNDDILADRFTIDLNEEPQIMFNRNAAEGFDGRRPYGKRPKADLLKRLGYPGPWQRWSSDPWDLVPLPDCADRWAYSMSKGWVFRLSSGVSDLETGVASSLRRTEARRDAISQAIARVTDAVGTTPPK